MACLIEAFYRHSLLTPLTSPWASSHPAGRMRKIKFALLSEQFVARDEQHGFSLRGVNPILARTSSFFRRLLPLLVLRLSPPSHRTALCSSGGRGACAAASVLASLPSCGGAFWQGDKVIQFSYRKFPSSGTITRCIRVHSHVRTHSHSLSALPLSLYLHHL